MLPSLTDFERMQSVEEYNTLLAAERKCSRCPMVNRGAFVGVDTATGFIEQQTIMFLGLNPGHEEAIRGLPFVGPSGRFLRKYLEWLSISSWMMTNSLLCSTPNEHQIIEAERTRAVCRINLASIFKKFLPKIIVPCGNGAWSIFGTHLGITQAAQHLFVSRGPAHRSPPVLVAPLVHPSALIRSGGEKSPKFEQFYNRLALINSLANNLKEHDVPSLVDSLNASGQTVAECFS